MAKPERQAFFDAQYAATHGRDEEALDYPLYRYLLPYATGRNEVAAKLLGGARWKNVIELGAGNGAFVQLKLKDFERYLGLDISPYQLSLVPEPVRLAPNVRLQTADLEDGLDFPDASFDLAVSLGTIDYLRDPIAFVREVHRVLEPGGTLLLHAMNLAFLPRRIQLLFGKLPTYNSALGWQGGVLHEFTLPTLQALVTDLGFDIEERGWSGLFPPTRSLWPNLLACDVLLRCRKR